MKKKRSGRAWPASWVLTASVLVAISFLYARVSYQSLQEWKGLRSRLEACADKEFSAPVPEKAGVSDDREGIVSNLIDTHGLTLLSWHQARQGDGQILMLEGSFSSILSWLNDWQKDIPHGSVNVMEWVPTGESTVITVEVYGISEGPAADKKIAGRGSRRR